MDLDNIASLLFPDSSSLSDDKSRPPRIFDRERRETLFHQKCKNQTLFSSSSSSHSHTSSSFICLRQTLGTNEGAGTASKHHCHAAVAAAADDAICAAAHSRRLARAEGQGPPPATHCCAFEMRVSYGRKMFLPKYFSFSSCTPKITTLTTCI